MRWSEARSAALRSYHRLGSLSARRLRCAVNPARVKSREQILDLAAQPAIRTRLQATLGFTYSTLGLEANAIPLLEQVRDFNRASFGLKHPATLDSMQALALQRKVNGPEHPHTLMAMNNLTIRQRKRTART